MAAVDEVDPDELRELYHETNLSVNEVADEIGYSNGTLYTLLDEFGIEHRSPDGLSPDDGSPIQFPELHDQDWLRHQYVELGKSCREIADETGSSNTHVSKMLRKHGIDTSDSNPPEFPEIHDADYLRQKTYEERMSVRQISDEVGCSKDAVGKMMRRFGIRSYQKWPVEMRLPGGLTQSEFIDMYESTQSLAKVGDRIGVGSATVASWLDGLGVERRRGVASGPDHPSWNPNNADYYGENWWSQRRKALSEAGFECRVCGMGRAEHREKYGFDLDVHHVTPISEYESPEDANNLENLVVLCRPCHAKYEGLPVLPTQS